MLDLGVDLDAWPWVWLVVAVLLALLEISVLAGSFVLLPFAVSAFAASLLGFYDVAIEVQWSVFVFGGGLLWIGFYRWARTFLRENVLPPGVGADRLVGTIGTVTVAVAPDDTERKGRVALDGETWGAVVAGGAAVAAGTRVVVKGMQGTRVVIEPIPSDDPPADSDAGSESDAASGSEDESRTRSDPEEDGS